jgi:hypothetical protein
MSECTIEDAKDEIIRKLNDYKKNKDNNVQNYINTVISNINKIDNNDNNKQILANLIVDAFPENPPENLNSDDLIGTIFSSATICAKLINDKYIDIKQSNNLLQGVVKSPTQEIFQETFKTHTQEMSQGIDNDAEKIFTFTASNGGEIKNYFNSLQKLQKTDNKVRVRTSKQRMLADNISVFHDQIIFKDGLKSLTVYLNETFKLSQSKKSTNWVWSRYLTRNTGKVGGKYKKSKRSRKSRKSKRTKSKRTRRN